MMLPLKAMENEGESPHIGITCMSARWQVCENTGRRKQFVTSLHVPVVENTVSPEHGEMQGQTRNFV